LDHTLLTVNIVVFKEHIQTKTCTIVKNSEEEKNFLAKLINSIKSLNIDYILSKKSFELVQEFTYNMEEISSNIQKLSISPNIQNYSETRIVK